MQRFINLAALIALAALVFEFARFLCKERRVQGRAGGKAARVAVRLLALGAVLVLWMFFPFRTNAAPTGPYVPLAVDFVLTDTNRPDPYADDGSARWLPVTVWYPSSAELAPRSCPLILFSHGSFGVKESNATLYRELASHGYVVCAVDHTHHSLSATDAQGRTVRLNGEYVRQILDASDSTPEKRAELAGLFAEWMGLRTGDLAFVLDSLTGPETPALAAASDAMARIDPARIGVMGHSLGGAAALAFGRTRPEVRAVIALEAPFMGDVEGVADGQLVFRDLAYPVPLLHFYTDAIGPRLGTLPQYAQNAAIAADDRDTTFDLYVRGAGHMTLTDLVHTRPALCLLFGQDLLFDVSGFAQSFNQTCLDFFNAFLKDQGGFEPTAFEPVGAA